MILADTQICSICNKEISYIDYVVRQEWQFICSDCSTKLGIEKREKN